MIESEEQRRRHDQSAVLTLIGVLLFMPPLINVLDLPIRFAEVPLVVWYLYMVWATLIFLTALLSRRLQHHLRDNLDAEVTQGLSAHKTRREQELSGSSSD